MGYHLNAEIMNKIGIFYGSSTGNTEIVAEKLQSLLGTDRADLHNAESATKEDIEKYKYLIFGTPTWGIGDMQDDMEDFIVEVTNIDLSEKKVAIFGLGDQDTYPESFVDGIGILYDKLKEKTNVVGNWPLKGYGFNDSEAVRGNKFVGLAIDQDNQPGQTEERLGKWVELLKKEFV